MCARRLSSVSVKMRRGALRNNERTDETSERTVRIRRRLFVYAGALLCCVVPFRVQYNYFTMGNVCVCVCVLYRAGYDASTHLPKTLRGARPTESGLSFHVDPGVE